MRRNRFYEFRVKVTSDAQGDAQDVGTDDAGAVEIIGPVTGDETACAACTRVPRLGTLTVAGRDGVARWCVPCTATALDVGPVAVRLEAGRYRDDPELDPVVVDAPCGHTRLVSVALACPVPVARHRWSQSRAGPRLSFAQGGRARDDDQTSERRGNGYGWDTARDGERVQLPRMPLRAVPGSEHAG